MARLQAHLVSHMAPVRKAQGLTQQQLGHMAGVSRQTIVEIEAGGYNPSTMLALRLATALSTTVEDLFQLPPIAPTPPIK